MGFPDLGPKKFFCPPKKSGQKKGGQKKWPKKKWPKKVFRKTVDFGLFIATDQGIQITVVECLW